MQNNDPQVQPTLVDLTSPPPGNSPDPSSSNRVMQMHNKMLDLRTGNTICFPVQGNKQLGQMVQPTTASIARFQPFMSVHRQEVVNLVEEEDGRDVGMRGRSNTNYPLRLDQRMLHDSTGV